MDKTIAIVATASLLAVGSAWAGPSTAAPGDAARPSFDCKAARSSYERQVCADPRLASLDTIMADAYAQARRQAPGPALAVARLLQKQSGECEDPDCIMARQVGAIGKLRDLGATVEFPAFVPEEQRPLPPNPALPQSVGQCVRTAVAAVHPRLGDDEPAKDEDFDMGTGVEFQNGGYQVSYENEPAIRRSHRGDPVRMCLVKFPRNCPLGDDRGRIYTSTNLRTGGSWTLPDSQHSCGGA